MRRCFFMIWSVCLLWSVSLWGQENEDSVAWFQTRSYGKYVVADHYAPILSINTGMVSNAPDYNIDVERSGAYIPLNETVLGGDIPFYQRFWDNQALSLSFPLSIALSFDFSEAETAPILNTDYRFALLELNYWHKLAHPYFKNWGIKFIPFFHESTHIGDELTLARIAADASIIRVNVTYEAMNLAFTLNDPLGQDQRNSMYRIGAKFLLNPNKGWYSFSAREGDTILVSPSQRWIEPYVQYQYQNPASFLSFGNTMFVLSADLSLRVKFSYPYLSYDGQNYTDVITSEYYVPSLTLMAGWQFYNSDHVLSDFGLFLRAYRGLNYHGQFRNLDNYEFYGFSIVYGL